MIWTNLGVKMRKNKWHPFLKLFNNVLPILILTNLIAPHPPDYVLPEPLILINRKIHVRLPLHFKYFRHQILWKDNIQTVHSPRRTLVRLSQAPTWIRMEGRTRRVGCIIVYSSHVLEHSRRQLLHFNQDIIEGHRLVLFVEFFNKRQVRWVMVVFEMTLVTLLFRIKLIIVWPPTFIT